MSANQHQNQAAECETITIGGRSFAVGRAYEGKRTGVKRTFLGKHEWRGWVHYRGSQGAVPITAGAWARWAGDEASSTQ